MLRGLLVLIAFVLAGRVVGLVLPLPASVVGMVLLAVALERGVLSLGTVKPAADGLLRHMGLFFVPAGVAIATQADALRRSVVPLLVASVVSFVLVFAVVGLVYRALASR
jgi:holin-like protein